MAKTIYLVRHAQAEHNVAEDWSIADAPLTALGRQQARHAGIIPLLPAGQEFGQRLLRSGSIHGPIVAKLASRCLEHSGGLGGVGHFAQEQRDGLADWPLVCL